MRNSNEYNQVGKRVCGYIYVHITAVNTLTPEQALYVAQCLQAIRHSRQQGMLPNDFTFNVVKVSLKEQSVSFIYSPDFDTAHEPYISYSVKFDGLKHGKVRHESKTNPTIYHGKGFFVKDNYEGFSKKASIDRYYMWQNIEQAKNKSLIGRKVYWEQHVVPAINLARACCLCFNKNKY